MKFTLSKKQWEYLGKQAGWTKVAQVSDPSKEQVNVIKRNLLEKGDVPPWAEVWAKTQLEQGNFPKVWMDSINQYVLKWGEPPTFAYNWFRNKLQRGDVTTEQLAAMHKSIDEMGVKSPFGLEIENAKSAENEGMTKEAACGLLCSKCKKCPEDIGLKEMEGGIVTKCCGSKATRMNGEEVSDYLLKNKFGYLIK